MERLPMETEKILRAFQKAKAGILPVKKLKALLPEADAYQTRIGQLSDAGFIVPSAWEEGKKYDIVIDTGAATAFRITVNGRDYLAQLDQKYKHRSQKNGKKINSKARSKQKMRKDGNYDRHTALINLIVAIIGLMLAVGSAITFLIEHLN